LERGESSNAKEAGKNEERVYQKLEELTGDQPNGDLFNEYLKEIRKTFAEFVKNEIEGIKIGEKEQQTMKYSLAAVDFFDDKRYDMKSGISKFILEDMLNCTRKDEIPKLYDTDRTMNTELYQVIDEIRSILLAERLTLDPQQMPELQQVPEQQRTEHEVLRAIRERWREKIDSIQSAECKGRYNGDLWVSPEDEIKELIRSAKKEALEGLKWNHIQNLYKLEKRQDIEFENLEERQKKEKYRHNRLKFVQQNYLTELHQQEAQNLKDMHKDSEKELKERCQREIQDLKATHPQVHKDGGKEFKERHRREGQELKERHRRENQELKERHRRENQELKERHRREGQELKERHRREGWELKERHQQALENHKDECQQEYTMFKGELKQESMTITEELLQKYRRIKEERKEERRRIEEERWQKDERLRKLVEDQQRLGRMRIEEERQRKRDEKSRR
jgi:hypothetical protein